MRVVDLVELFESALRFGAKAKLTSVCCALNVEAGLKPRTDGGVTRCVAESFCVIIQDTLTQTSCRISPSGYYHFECRTPEIWVGL